MTSPVRLLALASFVLVTACDDEKKTAPAPTASVAVSAPPAETSAAPVASAPKAAPDAVAAQHVLVAYKGAKNAPKTVARSKAEAKQRAEEVLGKAKGGGDFTALVSEYSDDPGSRERAGSVGKFTRDRMVKPFSDAAFALDVGGVSAVVETEFGFHVIKRNQ